MGISRSILNKWKKMYSGISDALKRGKEVLFDHDIRVAIETLMNYQDKEHIEYFLKEIQPGRLLANKKFKNSNWGEKGYFLSEEPLQEMEENLSTSSFLNYERLSTIKE